MYTTEQKYTVEYIVKNEEKLLRKDPARIQKDTTISY